MMSEIEKIERYIDRTKINDEKSLYNMRSFELFELFEMEDRVYALMLAFKYGRAKGERHARKELKA